jgi:hypothetical protein
MSTINLKSNFPPITITRSRNPPGRKMNLLKSSKILPELKKNPQTI